MVFEKIEEQQDSFSLSELEEMINEYEIKRDVVFNERDRDGSPIERSNAILNDFLNELLDQKDKFERVFKTSSGSYYFVLDTGESLRFKKTEKKYEDYELKDLMEKQLMVSEETMGRIKEEGFGIPIPLADFEVGNLPFEIKGRFVVNEDEGVVSIEKGSDVDEYHYGHKVVEIIK